MSVEIVSRWDKSKVLYRAETAQDVRQAVVEAAQKRAFLRGADLGGAFLGGAFLGGADLGPERSEAQSPKDCQTDSKERESASLRPLTEAEAVKAINRALSAMHGSEYVGGPTECEAWRISAA